MNGYTDACIGKWRWLNVGVYHELFAGSSLERFLGDKGHQPAWKPQSVTSVKGSDYKEKMCENA